MVHTSALLSHFSASKPPQQFFEVFCLLTLLLDCVAEEAAAAMSEIMAGNATDAQVNTFHADSPHSLPCPTSGHFTHVAGIICW